MRPETAELLKQASEAAVRAISSTRPDIAAQHHAQSVRLSAKALLQLSEQDRQRSSLETL
jgi:HEPN domain-containing protein